MEGAAGHGKRIGVDATATSRGLGIACLVVDDRAVENRYVVAGDTAPQGRTIERTRAVVVDRAGRNRHAFAMNAATNGGPPAAFFPELFMMMLSATTTSVASIPPA